MKYNTSFFRLLFVVGRRSDLLAGRQYRLSDPGHILTNAATNIQLTRPKPAVYHKIDKRLLIDINRYSTMTSIYMYCSTYRCLQQVYGLTFRRIKVYSINKLCLTTLIAAGTVSTTM